MCFPWQCFDRTGTYLDFKNALVAPPMIACTTFCPAPLTGGITCCIPLCFPLLTSKSFITDRRACLVVGWTGMRGKTLTMSWQWQWCISLGHTSCETTGCPTCGACELLLLLINASAFRLRWISTWQYLRLPASHPPRPAPVFLPTDDHVALRRTPTCGYYDAPLLLLFRQFWSPW